MTADVGMWRKVLDKLEIGVYIVGFVANTMTLNTLMTPSCVSFGTVRHLSGAPFCYMCGTWRLSL